MNAQFISFLLQQMLRALVVGGLLCVVGQLLFDVARLTPAEALSLLVSAGAVAGVCGWWQQLTDFAGFGARLPIVNFGALLAQSARQGAARAGIIGLFSDMLQPVSAGISLAVAAGFAVALLFSPKR